MFYFKDIYAKLINPFKPSVAFNIKTSVDLHCKSNGWFPYEMQHWTKMG